MENPLRLLIADDNLEMRQLLRRSLGREGYHVTAVANGREAIEYLRRNDGEVDLLITDLRMPEKDGEELLAEARRLNPALKVVIITGYSNLEQYLALMKKGAFEYVTKPFKIPDLLDVIERATEHVKG